MPKGRLTDPARILVTCDTSPLGTAAIDAAAALARRMDAELAGLFVEDINLLRMAALPFAREYALASAMARRMEAGDVERALQQQADALRTALSRAAQALAVPWSFQVVRGALLDSVLEAMHEADFAVFGHTGQFAVTASGRPHAETIAAARPVLTLYDGTLTADRALAAAQALAQGHHTDLVVLVIARDNVAAKALRERAATLLQGSRGHAHFHSLRSREYDAIRKAVETHHAAALLWHGTQSADEKKTLSMLVDALKCPVILVS